MRNDGPMHQAMSRSRASGESAATSNVCYVEPAAMTAVMMEQLQYLVSHATRTCPPGCEDCARLNQVRNWLLVPFRSIKTSARRRSAVA
jgi:hypothetical protein